MSSIASHLFHYIVGHRLHHVLGCRYFVRSRHHLGSAEGTSIAAPRPPLDTSSMEHVPASQHLAAYITVPERLQADSAAHRLQGRPAVIVVVPHHVKQHEDQREPLSRDHALGLGLFITYQAADGDEQDQRHADQREE